MPQEEDYEQMMEGESHDIDISDYDDFSTFINDFWYEFEDQLKDMVGRNDE